MATTAVRCHPWQARHPRRRTGVQWSDRRCGRGRRARRAGSGAGSSASYRFPVTEMEGPEEAFVFLLEELVEPTPRFGSLRGEAQDLGHANRGVSCLRLVAGRRMMNPSVDWKDEDPG